MIRINEKLSHDIYFTVDVDGMYGLLTLQGNKEECIEKANAWLQWEVFQNLLEVIGLKKMPL